MIRTEILLRRRDPMSEGLLLLGARPARIVARHLLPASLGPAVVLLSTDAGAVILAVATLSFLGLGVRPPNPEWGAMLVEARPYLESHWWLVAVPGAAITAVVLACNFLAEDAGRRLGPMAPTTRAPVLRRLASGLVTPQLVTASPDGTTPLLAVRELRVQVAGSEGWQTIVPGLSFELDRGETLALVGESGSGKTMSMAAMLSVLPAGVTARISGSASLSGTELIGLSHRRLRAVQGGRIALVGQELSRSLNPLRRVGHQVGEAARIHRGMGRGAARQRAIELLAYCGIDDPARVANLRPHQLSGGMRQRAMIAAALAGEPELVIADEPTSALDITVQRQILRLLRRLQDDLGMSTILITHDFGVVAGLADRVAVMAGGEIVETGPTGDIIRRPRHSITRQLVSAVTRLRNPDPDRTHPAPLEPARPLVELHQAGVLFPGHRVGLSSAPAVAAVAGVDLVIRPGEAIGLVGESGCGKTTLARAIVGLQPLTTGTLRRPARGGPGARKGKPWLDRRAQLMFQDPSAALDQRQSIASALDEALLLQAGGRCDRRHRRAGIDQLLSRVGLGTELRERRPWQLSGGQRQRVVLARVLSAAPELLILDEPMSSLDTTVQAELLGLLGGLSCAGTAIVLVSHDLAVVAHLADRVLVMYAGRVVESGPPGQVLTRPRHPFTQELVAAVPSLDPAQERHRLDVPSPRPAGQDPRDGCPFRRRCPVAIARCGNELPLLIENSAGHAAACHLARGLDD